MPSFLFPIYHPKAFCTLYTTQRHALVPWDRPYNRRGECWSIEAQLSSPSQGELKRIPMEARKEQDEGLKMVDRKFPTITQHHSLQLGSAGSNCTPNSSMPHSTCIVSFLHALTSTMHARVNLDHAPAPLVSPMHDSSNGISLRCPKDNK